MVVFSKFKGLKFKREEALILNVLQVPISPESKCSPGNEASICPTVWDKGSTASR